MTALKTIAYRLPPDLIERIDAYAAMRARVDGRPCNRSSAIRVLLEKALAQQTPPKPERITGEVTDSFERPPVRQLLSKPLSPPPARKRRKRRKKT